MNLSAFLISIVHEAAERARSGLYESQLGIVEALVFAWVAIEALLNEQAYIEIHDWGHGSKAVYEAVERGAHGFERVQAILTYLYGGGLEDGRYPANDLKHLGRLRNGLVHYKFRDPRVVSTLNDLTQRGLLLATSVPWDQLLVTWVNVVKPELAEWAYHTACDTAMAIAELMPDDEAHHGEVEVIRGNFTKRPLSPLRAAP